MKILREQKVFNSSAFVVGQAYAVSNESHHIPDNDPRICMLLSYRPDELIFVWTNQTDVGWNGEKRDSINQFTLRLSNEDLDNWKITRLHPSGK